MKNQSIEITNYKAAAIYTRSAFEQIIRKHCEKKKKLVVFKSQPKKYTSPTASQTMVRPQHNTKFLQICMEGNEIEKKPQRKKQHGS